MKAADYRKKDTVELKDELQKLYEEMKENADNTYKGNEKNVKKNKYLRKRIARIKTVINEKAILESDKNE